MRRRKPFLGPEVQEYWEHRGREFTITFDDTDPDDSYPYEVDEYLEDGRIEPIDVFESFEMARRAIERGVDADVDGTEMEED